jgi:uncharacterized protein (TIGR03083 family)
MREAKPIIVTDLFPAILAKLLKLLSELSAEEWDKPTACADWSVKDVALHLLGDDIGLLSRRRDEYLLAGQPIENWDDLVDLINALNDLWVKAARRISPRLLRDLLAFSGEQICQYFASLDPYVVGEPVQWAGPDPTPVWLDLAREYTERWHHQQHIRDAVGKPDLKQPRFFAPVLDAFVRAWSHTYREIEAENGTLLALVISGEAGGRWFLLREGGGWKLYMDVTQAPHTEVVIPQELAWRLFTKGIGRQEALAHTTISGDRRLGLRVLDMISIIA